MTKTARSKSGVAKNPAIISFMFARSRSSNFALWFAFITLWLYAPASRAQVKVAPTPGIAPAISAEQYARELANAERLLRAQKTVEQRDLKSPLSSLAVRRDVRRQDGVMQRVDGSVWKLFLEESENYLQPKPAPTPKSTPNLPPPPIVVPSIGTTPTARAVTDAVALLEVQGRGLQEWAQPSDGKYLQASADAAAYLKSLEKQGVIRTGPTGIQKWLQSAWRSLYGVWDNFVDWFDELFSRSSSSNVPTVDPKWAQAIALLAVAGVLLLAAILAWRAIGGRWRRAEKPQSLLKSEDEALLELPPDELLDRAETYARAGNFREALRHRYLSLLLQLEARGVWRYARRRTNWEHLARLRITHAHNSAGVEQLSALTSRFDRVRYGNAPCDRAHWETFDRDAKNTLESLSATRGATPPKLEVAR